MRSVINSKFDKEVIHPKGRMIMKSPCFTVKKSDMNSYLIACGTESGKIFFVDIKKQVC